MSITKITEEFSPTVLTSGQIRMKCPFTENHLDGSGNMSMYLSPNINAYHCFSCKAKGRLTNLLTKKFDVPFFDALEMVHIEEYVADKKQSVEDTEYYWDLTPPQEFLDRGFTKELLLQKKIGTDENITVVPMYWGTVLRGIKYRQNYPTRNFWYSKGFNKEEYLYNGDSCYTDYVIIVEGESDALRLLSWGFNVYALLGTSLSEWQSIHISKTKKVFLSLDCDLPGISGMETAYQKLNKLTDVMFINYPASDPADCSYRAYKHAYNNPCNYAEFKLLSS